MKLLSWVFKAVGVPLAHLIPLTLLWTGTTGRDWAVFGVTYILVMFAVGGGLHRYFAHKSFRTSRAFQFVLALMAACFFGDAIEFTAKHRWHHRYSDGRNDLHSPVHGFWQCWIGHMMENRLTKEDVFRMTPDLTRFPELVWLHRFWFAPGMAAATLFLVLGGYRMFACAYCLAFLVGMHGPSAVNYFCHKGRRRNFETGDASSNSIILGVLFFGEGWHNNHHYYPSVARSGFFWYELDGIYWLLKALSWIGIVWSVRDVPRSAGIPRVKRAEEATPA
jgi:stearoyl-CoA desaturase (Delta-9 desaturase)